MTFDEAIERVNEISEDQVEDRLDTAMWLIGELRQEYAPTIEMTQEQKEYYASRTLLSGLVFNQNTQYYTDEIHNIPREIAIAIIHPETIKVVDE